MTSSLLLVLGVFVSGAVAEYQNVFQQKKFQHISGTFLDIQYDARLKYANGPALDFSCEDWTAKIKEFQEFGIEHIIFQAAHDDRFGAYYNSSLHTPWKGKCLDVTATVLDAADHLGMKVWLSSEYTKTEYDNVTDPGLMNGRHAIMRELVQRGYTNHTSFEGWYFSCEAYLTPYFVPKFLTYIAQMAAWAKEVTPAAKRFVSPYGTRTAVNDDTFVAQLRQLKRDVDIVAYQDEVGCIRDEFPLDISAKAFRNLRAAHDRAGGPTLWANVESFTWEDLPNNVTSALIPAPFPRILAQAAAATAAGVERTITFTVETLYQKPGSPVSWGLPAAQREYESYEDYYTKGTAYSKVLASCLQGSISHRGIGLPVDFASDPDPAYSSGKLTDGVTGGPTPYDRRWLGFGEGSDVTAVIHLGQRPTRISSVGAHFLAVPSHYYVDGHTPAARNVTAYLPVNVTFAVSNDMSEWTDIGHVTTKWWEQEYYDIRTELYLLEKLDLHARHLRMTARNERPPWLKAADAQAGRLFIDEVVINHEESSALLV